MSVRHFAQTLRCEAVILAPCVTLVLNHFIPATVEFVNSYLAQVYHRWRLYLNANVHVSILLKCVLTVHLGVNCVSSTSL